jgi:hypothetical protein
VAATLARGEYRPIADQAPAGSPVETIALQLTDGRQCEVNYGALDSVGPPGFDSPTVTYTCGPLTYLVDQPDRKKELWTIESAKASKDYKYTLTGVVYIAQAYAVEPDL